MIGEFTASKTRKRVNPIGGSINRLKNMLIVMIMLRILNIMIYERLKEHLWQRFEFEISLIQLMLTNSKKIMKKNKQRWLYWTNCR